MSKLNELQLKEIKAAATALATQKKWDSLSWDDAWSGVSADNPSEKEIEQIYNIMIQDAELVLQAGVYKTNFSTEEEHIRMIYLESCSSLKSAS